MIERGPNYKKSEMGAELFMVNQFYSNMTSDHQPKKLNHLNFLVPERQLTLSILQTELWKSEDILKKEKYINFLSLQH